MRLGLFGFIVSVFIPAFLSAAEAPSPEQRQASVIRQDIDRRDISPPTIDAYDFEASVFAGLLSINDFGTEPVYGAALSFHVTEDFFLEAVYGLSEVSDSTYRNIGLTLFESETESIDYYQLSIGYNFLPGEVFWSKSRAWASSYYLVAGAGSTSFVVDDEFTYNVGFGLRILPMEMFSIRFEARDLIFKTDVLGQSELKHNLQMNMVLGFYF
ncbi:MAG: outer membrane beta-barrel domain-containing protein [Gammaproteobacteria bacterium]|nr:outer membrane beta-barrel domain-containing protein [Gammaproteobacteria bacterium]